jgi:cellobiose-specific phosphotransferase system component IIA
MRGIIILSIILLFSFGCLEEQNEVSKKYTELNWDSMVLAGSTLSKTIKANSLWEKGEVDQAIATLKIAEESAKNASKMQREMCELAKGREDLDCNSHLINKTEICLIPKIQFLQKKFQLDKEQQNCSIESCLNELKRECSALIDKAEEIDLNCSRVDPDYDDFIGEDMKERCQKMK